MREELDLILEQIGATFMTTAEWAAAADVLGENKDNVSKYKALRSVLLSRGGEDNALERLKHYFLALGLSPAELDMPAANFCNIFVGAPL